MKTFKRNQKSIVVFIAIFIGILHFVTGSNYHGPFRNFVNGYLIDILLPFAMYLVLGVANQSIICSAYARGAFVFMVGATTETLQYFNIPIFGRTFDPVDYLMFVIGIFIAVAFEFLFLSKFSK